MSATKGALSDYHRKRDFSSTKEPRGSDGAADDQTGFVVQIHDASTMHFDFRLEVDGVLKSWAPPQGALRVTRTTSGWPCPPRTTRWSTASSKASSPSASTEEAP